ncbi:hypothetical protein C3747_170g60 [Trypanosoma cruzi]|uniref:RING-type E3 ubiquitin transferase n=2 Tax=Trypanosoma cruzi TaxID=5693 RepID=Q4D549_TRYCC|nr:hypothetical protein, conserved [Trypanosoma cruzi]EAN87651.1 hypothetical protein, conserved [Trypanosoma cruzi]PWV03739.1 hypothetical protein C3747_170g60 [Trypanosoma cruzi]RNC45514.1 hypothetical protein TcCL_NonESM04765 [Trypanosoma cruzi]|eukprot:XP_809502.1 hypothetical protein [Trypanosoma cruzi strain CL Brener]
MSTKEGVCRICHRDRGRLVSPCTCEGSMKYVHSRCLSDWVYHRRSLSCEVCGTTYSAAKVFNFQLTDGAPGFFILCWICARHYMKRYLGMLTFAVLHTLVVIFIPFIVAFFHYAIPPSDPLAMRWHPVIQLLPESGPFSPQIFFAVGAVLTLCAVPLFLLWKKWQEWLALGEGDVLGLDFGEEEEAAQQPSVNPVLVESDEEVDEEPDGEIGGQRLVPATLPEENATVFEAITLLRQKSKDHFGGGYLSSNVFHSSLHFILFYAAMWTFLKFVPEIMRLTAAFLWNFFDGGSNCNAALERVLQLTAISEGNSRMRHAMLMLFVDALGSSTLISWSILYVRRSFSLWCIFWLVKYLRRLPHRKTLSFLVVYFRGILNVIALTCYGLLTVCFLTTLICLEFFVAETSFASNDYETAWKIATGVSSKKMDHALALGHRPQVGTGSSPLTMLKALSVLSGVHENDTCGNFGDVQTRLMTTGANISDGFNRSAWAVDGDDPLLLPLFIATVFVSKVDSVSIVEMGYMAVYFALFLPCMARFLIHTVPVEWLSWSSLYRLLHSNLFEGIRFCDLKALIFIYGEILVYTVVCSFTLLRCSLALVRVINPSLVPIALLANTSIPSFACWMRLSLLCYTTHRDVLEGAYKLLTSTLENVFNIRQVMHGGSFSLPRVLSRAVRILAFVIFYWLVTVVTLAAHAIPGLHVLGKRGSLVRLFLLFDVQLHIILYSLFPLGFPQQGGLLRVLSPRIGLLLAHWKHRWWFGSCLGLWLDSSEVRAGNRLGYSVRSIRKVPGDVGSRFLSSIDAVLVRLEEYKKGPRGTRPIERLQETLKSLASKNDVIYFFLEEDVRLLLECMNPPTIQQFLCYILNCVVLLILQPFFSGAAWVVMVRRFFFKPHCNVGVDAWFILLAWFCGVAITVSLCTMRVKVFGAPKRLLVYLFCGCQHFTIKNAMAFILIPHFMHIASISFVPYTLHNLLCFLLVSGGRERYWTGHVFYYVASTVLLGAWSFLLEMREIERRYRNKLRGVVEGGAERLILPRVLGHSVRVFLLDTPADGRARVRDGEVAPGRDVGVGAPQQIHDVEDLRGKIMGNARAFVNSVTESAVRFLRKVAERQNIMGVVFVDHPSVSA